MCISVLLKLLNDFLGDLNLLLTKPKESAIAVFLNLIFLSRSIVFCEKEDAELKFLEVLIID